MKLVKSKEDLDRLLHRIRVVQSKYRTWRTEAKDDANYYFNRVWTQDERARLRRRGQSDVSINRVYPIVEHQKAMLSLNKLGVRYFPVDKSDDAIGRAINMVTMHILNNSNFEDVTDKVVEHMLIYGVGYYYVYADPNADNGQGEVFIDYIHPMNVFWDLRAKRFDWSDANFCFVIRRFEKNTLMNLFPEYAEKIQKVEASDNIYETITGNRDNSFFTDDTTVFDDDVMITMTEYYQKVRVKYHRLVINGIAHILDDATFKQEIKTNIQLRQLIDSGQVIHKPFWKIQIQAVTIIGEDIVIQDSLTSLEDFPIIPVVRQHDDSVFPMSEVRYLRPINDEINKLHMLLIAHTTQSTNMKILYEEGTIDVKKWEDEAAIPGALLPFRPGSFNQPPQFIHPQPLNSGLFQVIETDKYDIEYTSGTYSYSQGSPQNAHETFRGILVLEEFANKRLGYKSKKIYRALHRLGKVLLKYIKTIYTYPKVVRITQPNGQVEQIMINGVRQGENGALEFFNRISDVEYDIIPDGNILLPTNRMALAEFYMQLYKEGLVDRSAVLDKLELPDRMEIEQRINQMQQLAMENQQLQQQLQQANQELAKLGEKTVELERKMKIEREINALRNDVIKAKSQVNQQGGR